jgi:hypothetical protein
MFRYAGYVAEKRACGQASAIASRHDFRVAANALALVHPQADVAAAEGATLQEVEAIISDPNIWRAVVAVARVLEEAGEIDPDSATELIDRVQHENPW